MIARSEAGLNGDKAAALCGATEQDLNNSYLI